MGLSEPDLTAYRYCRLAQSMTAFIRTDVSSEVTPPLLLPGSTGGSCRACSTLRALEAIFRQKYDPRPPCLTLPLQLAFNYRPVSWVCKQPYPEQPLLMGTHLTRQNILVEKFLPSPQRMEAGTTMAGQLVLTACRLLFLCKRGPYRGPPMPMFSSSMGDIQNGCDTVNGPARFGDVGPVPVGRAAVLSRRDVFQFVRRQWNSRHWFQFQRADTAVHHFEEASDVPRTARQPAPLLKLRRHHQPFSYRVSQTL